MCYSFESSLTAWLLANGISLYLFQRNQNYDRWNSAFISTFTTIQLLEAGLWKYHSSENMVSLLTKLILIFLLLQPFMQSFMGYKFTKNNLLYYMSLLYLGVLMYSVYRTQTEEFTTHIGPNGHLVWETSKDGKETPFLGGMFISCIYLAGLFVPLMLMKPEYKGWLLIGIGLLTALYSYLTSKGEEFSSMWCYTSVIYAGLCIFL